MRLSVEGMTCGHCTSTVQSVLEGFEGVVASVVCLVHGSPEIRRPTGELPYSVCRDIMCLHWCG